jgi:hypothetical protein
MKEQKILFQKLDINKKSAKNIHFIQLSFERFCENMSRKCPSSEEKQQAIYRMQEACVWFCRALAQNQINKKESINLELVKVEPIKVEPTPEELADQEYDKQASIKANAMSPESQKSVIVIYKKGK